MRKEMMEHLEEMVIKVEKGIPFSRGRDSKYEEYFSTIDGMNIGDSFEVFDISIGDHMFSPNWVYLEVSYSST